MLTASLLGMLLLIAGVLQMAWTAIRRGRMSDPAPNPDDTARPTLEPSHRGAGFLSLRAIWPGLVLLGLGALLLLLPTVG
jgi:hypothetical protein